MHLFYKPSTKEILRYLNDIFIMKGMSALHKKEFKKSPFSTSWFGKDDLKGYTYEFCRLSYCSILEIVEAQIIRGEKSIRINLNIFELSPEVNSLESLTNLKGLQFHLPPGSTQRMRLRRDDYNMIPLFRMLFAKEHKIGKYLTKKGFEKKVKALGVLIEEDMFNIDYYVKKWYKSRKPLRTDWNGKPLH